MNDSIGENIAEDMERMYVRSLLREIESIFEFWLFDNLTYLVRRNDLVDLKRFYDRKEFEVFSEALNSISSVELTRDYDAEKFFLTDRETVVFCSKLIHSFDNDFRMGYEVNCTRFIDYNQEIQSCSEEYIKNAKK